MEGTQVVSNDINISDRAASEVRRIMAENKILDTFGLRLGVKGGGCSGFTYVLGFDETKREGDLMFESKGVKVLVDQNSFRFLKGVVLDFQDGLSGKGFTFLNPNATRTCGCGNSFGA
ncbi:MAG: HesB/IscA family protein [Candidatus Kryptoniota bacterium]